MKVKYVGIDGKIRSDDCDVTIGKVYDVVACDDGGVPYPVEFIDDVGIQQCFSWDVLEIVEEGWQMKVKITGCKKSGVTLNIGEVVTIKIEDGYYHAFSENGERWTGRLSKLSFQDVIRQLNMRYEFEEVTEMFDVRDLRSGMVVEWQGITGDKYIDLLFVSRGEILGLTLGSRMYTREYESTAILRVWHPKVTKVEEIHDSLNDTCLIYDRNSEMRKLDRQKEREIEKLQSELSEIKSKLRELGAE